MLAVGGVGFLMLGLVQEWVMLLAVPVAFATGWAWLGSYNLAMVKLNPVAPGAAVGVTQTGAFVGAIVGPIGLGFLAEEYLVLGRLAGGRGRVVRRSGRSSSCCAGSSWASQGSASCARSNGR